MNEVIEFTALRDHVEYPYCAAYLAGTTLYAIKHKDRYFVWVYLNAAQATCIASKVQCDYNYSNWKASLDECCPSDLLPGQTRYG